MSDIDSILKTIENAANLAGSTLSLADKIGGRMGRGGPRWHRWRALRLRLRAVRIEGRRPDRARALRTQAAIHLTHALRLEGSTGGYLAPADKTALVALAGGIDPEAGNL